MMKNNFNPIPFFLLLLLFVYSCEKEKTNIDDRYIVDQMQATEIAKQLNINENKSLKKSEVCNKIGKTKTYFDDNEAPLLHVINLTNNAKNAFVIIAGDKREMPILAYGESEFNTDTLPYGVADWLQTEITYIKKLRKSETKQNIAIKNMWANVKLPFKESNSKRFKDFDPDPLPDPEDPCGTFSLFEVSPFLETTWGQGCVYNELCPGGCNTRCSHVPTGCVATAMAQVMNHYEFPQTYEWDSLLNIYMPWHGNATGADEIAQLMYDIGDAINMNYDCERSGARSAKIDNVLEEDFGYSNGGDYDDFSGNIEAVKSNIRDGIPVMFFGCQEIHFGGLWYTGCHAWVCDGYKTGWNDCYGWHSFT